MRSTAAQFCKLKRDREEEALRLQVLEDGTREEEAWLNPEEDEMAITAELGDGLLLSLIDDTVAEVLRVRALTKQQDK